METPEIIPLFNAFVTLDGRKGWTFNPVDFIPPWVRLPPKAPHLWKILIFIAQIQILGGTPKQNVFAGTVSEIWK